MYGNYLCVTMFEMVKMREKGPLGHILNSVGESWRSCDTFYPTITYSYVLTCHSVWYDIRYKTKCKYFTSEFKSIRII
jgi:hypothetical protein